MKVEIMEDGKALLELDGEGIVLSKEQVNQAARDAYHCRCQDCVCCCVREAINKKKERGEKHES